MSGGTGHNGGERIACPRCRANNFTGQAQCWQCGSPLPPGSVGASSVPGRSQPAPAAIAPLQTVSAPMPQAPAFAPRRPSRLGLSLLFLGVAALAFFAVLKLAGGPKPDLPAVARDARPFQPDAAPLSTSPAASTRDETASRPAPENDPLMAQAKREIERARGQLDLPAPASSFSDANGDIRLRSGGAIRREEWDAARRKLENSPLLRDPPPPRPF